MELTDAIPEPELTEEDHSQMSEGETVSFSPPKKLRPEAIMGIIALLSAVILALTVCCS